MQFRLMPSWFRIAEPSGSSAVYGWFTVEVDFQEPRLCSSNSQIHARRQLFKTLSPPIMLVQGGARTCPMQQESADTHVPLWLFVGSAIRHSGAAAGKSGKVQIQADKQQGNITKYFEVFCVSHTTHTDVLSAIYDLALGGYRHGNTPPQNRQGITSTFVRIEMKIKLHFEVE